MIISGLQKLTLIDYPGKLACTVFLAGCNFRCPWCHNPELVLPEMIEKGERIEEKDFFKFLESRKGSLEGVVLCGGEPTINPDIVSFAKKIKDMGFLVKLDTNGSNPEVVKELIDKGLIDYVAMDVKAPKDKYIDVIGFKGGEGSGKSRLSFWGRNILDNIEKTISLLKQGRIDYEFRTTVVPGFLKKQDIVEIARWISPTPSLGSGKIKKYFIQQFRQGKTVSPGFTNVKPYSSEYLIEILRAVEPFFETCKIRP